MGGDPELNAPTGEVAGTSDLAGPLVDIHTHILPGIDDGPRTIADAVRMLQMAEADGIDAIVATPHAHHCNPAEIPGLVDQLNEAAQVAGIAVQVLPGSEVRIAPDLVERFYSGQFLTLNNTNFMLLELYLQHPWRPKTVAKVIDRLTAAGLTPILAHPERYPYLRHDSSFVTDLLEAGVLLQLNAPSLDGYYGDEARQFAWQLIQHNQAQLIASDAHNPDWRPPLLRSAYQHILSQADIATVQAMINLALQVAGIKAC